MQVLLDHIAGNAQTSGDLIGREFVKAEHREDLAAAGRKTLYRLIEKLQSPLTIDLVVLQRPRLW